MTRKPLANIAANTLAFETQPLVKPTGFRVWDSGFRRRAWDTYV